MAIPFHCTTSLISTVSTHSPACSPCAAVKIPPNSELVPCTGAGRALWSLAAAPAPRAHTDSQRGAGEQGAAAGLLPSARDAKQATLPWLLQSVALLWCPCPQVPLHCPRATCLVHGQKYSSKESYNSYRLLWKLSLKQVWITQQLQQYFGADMIKNFYATSLIRRGLLGWKWNLCRKRLVLINFSTWKSVQIVSLFHFDISKQREKKERKSSFKSLFILRWVKFHYIINQCSNSFVQNFLLCKNPHIIALVSL